ncbi:MAG: hypothetical protein JOZ41_06820, partial [Chloroflexi bacterium]|nr:hypothetical protein [Chloroflexota bacterium]
MTDSRPALALEDRPVRHRLWPRLAGAPGRALLQSRRILGRYLSVRWKLTLWYGLMCAVALGAAGFAMSYRLQQQVQMSIDDGLRQTAQRMSHDLALQNNPHYQGHYTVLTPGAASRQIIRLFHVYESDVQNILNQYSYRDSQPGQFEQVQLTAPPGAPACILQSRTLQPCQQDMSRGVALGPEVFSAVIGYGPQWVDDSHGIINSGSNLRGYVATVPVPEPLSSDGVSAILEVFQQKHSYQEIQRQITLILTLAIPLVLLVALAAGWWIA